MTHEDASALFVKQNGNLTAAAAGCGGCSIPVDPFGGQAADKKEFKR